MYVSLLIFANSNLKCVCYIVTVSFVTCDVFVTLLQFHNEQMV